ncbi:MAG: recombinase family protein [Allorhizobium sp.]
MKVRPWRVFSRWRTIAFDSCSSKTEVQPNYPTAHQKMIEPPAANSQVHTVAIYCRTASSCKEEIRRQRAELENYASIRGWKVVLVFEDDGVSGSHCDRPGFMQMIDWTARPKRQFDMILVVSISRIARNHTLCSYWHSVLSSRGIQIESARGFK